MDIVEEKYKVFKQIIRECDYDNTYKLAWAKSLVELARDKVDCNDTQTQIGLNEIAKKFLKYYWNQTIFFNLIQGSNPNKPPEILTFTKDLISIYYDTNETKRPIRFERIEACLEAFGIELDYDKTIQNIVKTLKKDVSWRFLNVKGSDVKVYNYEKGDNELIIDASLLRIFTENEQDLYDLINYRWGMILENFNNSPRISKKVKIIDEQDIKRKSLSKYRKYLDLENEEHKCFVCGKPISEEDISIDHVIPWGYMYSDDIWNLVYVHKSCNSKKGIVIPDRASVDRLKARNERLLKFMEVLYKDKQLEELKMANEHDYVDKFWVGCKE